MRTLLSPNQRWLSPFPVSETACQSTTTRVAYGQPTTDRQLQVPSCIVLRSWLTVLHAYRAALLLRFSGAVVAADSWWRYNASLDVTSAVYQARLKQINAKLQAAGVDGCPTKCMMENPALGGCNETARCGVLYVLPNHQ